MTVSAYHPAEDFLARLVEQLQENPRRIGIKAPQTVRGGEILLVEFYGNAHLHWKEGLVGEGVREGTGRVGALVGGKLGRRAKVYRTGGFFHRDPWSRTAHY